MPEPGLSCPYPGLKPYTEAERDYFFGRDSDRRIIAANLVTARLTVLYGPSGAGKSSLLRAGVTPDLREQDRGVVVNFNRWSGPGFLQELKAACLAAIGEAAASLDANQPLDALLAAASGVSGPFLIILDQFEEYLLYHGAAGSDPFQSEFARAVNRKDVRANFLLSLREDWLSKLDPFRVRLPNLLRYGVRLRHLDAKAAEEAIRRPLSVYNERAGAKDRMEIEETLVEEVIRQAQTSAEGSGGTEPKSDGIRPPLLQLMMTRVWEEEQLGKSHILHLSTLERLGGAQKIFTAHLDKVMDKLGEPDRRISASVFGHLVTPMGSKIAQGTQDLVYWAGADPKRVTAVLASLTGERILCRIDQPERYEIFHDVLAPAILDWSRRYEKRKQARTRRRLWLAVSALTLYFLATLTVTLVSSIRSRQAREAQRQSLSRELARAAMQKAQSEDPELGLILALHALRIRDTPEAESALKGTTALSRVRKTLRGHSDAINRIVVSRDGARLATASADHTIRVWDASDGRSLMALSGHGGAVNDVAFSADGKQLASASEDGAAGIWDVASGQNLRMLRGESRLGAATSVAFSPVESLIATGSARGPVRIWDAHSGQVLVTCSGLMDRVRALAFSPDGRRLAGAGSDRSLLLWDAHSGRRLGATKGQDEIWGVAFSPDGKRIVFSGVEGVMRMWDGSAASEPAPFPKEARFSRDLTPAVAFSPAGDLVASGGFDRVARVFDLRSGQELYTLRGHTGAVSGLAFTADGGGLVTASADHTARVWDIKPGPESLVVSAGVDPLLGLAFSSDGRRIAAAGQDGVLRVWDSGSGARLVETGENHWPLSAVAFSPDGGRIATSSMDHTARIRDGASGKALLTLNHADSILDVVFSADGRQVATASWDGTAGVWDASSGKRIATLSGLGEVYGVAFRPNSKQLATAGGDGSAKLWDLESGRPLRTFSGHNGRVFSVAFSSDGSRIATGGDDGAARAWDAGSGAALLTIPAHNNWVHSVVFSPDGSQLLTAGRDGTAGLWDAKSGDRLREFPNLGGKVYRAVFNPNGSRLALATENGVLRVYGLPLSRALNDLVALARSRVTRPMTGAECNTFLHYPNCPDVSNPEVPIPGTADR